MSYIPGLNTIFVSEQYLSQDYILSPFTRLRAFSSSSSHFRISHFKYLAPQNENRIPKSPLQKQGSHITKDKMSSHYFPYQPPAHILQLSIQHIGITESSGSPSPPKCESPSTSSKKCSAPKASYPQKSPPTDEKFRDPAIQANFMSNLSEHQHAYTDQYAGKEIVSYAEFLERQGGPKVQLGGDQYFWAKAAKAWDEMKEQLAKARSEATANRMKSKNWGKKKALSSHRQRVGGGGEDRDEQ